MRDTICGCLCDNCCDDPHYSSYHCKHAELYGALESKGLCVVTMKYPDNGLGNWRKKYDALPGDKIG